MKGSNRSVEGRPLDDIALVERAKNGDVNAYEALVQHYQELAFRVAYQVTGNAADAEDAAQEGFVNAYYALGRFRAGAPFRPWLCRIVANEARNRRTSAQRRTVLAQRALVAQSSGDSAQSPEAAAEADEFRSTLVATLRTLREDDRLILAYRLFFDLSEAEMAEALKCPRGTVKSRLSRALARLRAALPADIRIPSSATPLDLGHRSSMADAQSAVGFTIAVPAELGAPDAVYVNTDLPGGEVALAYTPRPGIPLVKQTGLGVLVTEFRGDLVPGFISKGVGPGTSLQETSVNGDPGWWIAGEPHTIYVEVAGSGQFETLRMAANTLVWEHAGVTYRIESSLSKAESFG